MNHGRLARLILQPFRRFTYVTGHSPTVPLFHQRHSLFSNPSFTSPTSQALHLRHLASCPCYEYRSILLCARTRKVFTTLAIPAVAFKETTNCPLFPYSFKYFRGKILLTHQTDHKAALPRKLTKYWFYWPAIHLYLSSSQCSAQGQVFHWKLRLQFCHPKQFFHHQLRYQGCSFTRDWIGAVNSHCFPHPTHSL